MRSNRLQISQNMLVAMSTIYSVPHTYESKNDKQTQKLIKFNNLNQGRLLAKASSELLHGSALLYAQCQAFSESQFLSFINMIVLWFMTDGSTVPPEWPSSQFTIFYSCAIFSKE
jgi:hypothetical protein